MKRNHLICCAIVLGLGLLEGSHLFSGTASGLFASPEHPNVEVYGGGGWASAPTGKGSFDQLTLSAKGRVQYWIGWEKIQGQWVPLFRIRRSPKDPSVSSEEADTLDHILSHRSSGTLTIHHGNGGSSLEAIGENPREKSSAFGTIGK